MYQRHTLRVGKEGGFALLIHLLLLFHSFIQLWLSLRIIVSVIKLCSLIILVWNF